LILARKPGQSVVIGPNSEIRITVVEVVRGTIRLGIEADRSIPVFRSELLEREAPAPAEPVKQP
jgi:carbon storage regulator